MNNKLKQTSNEKLTVYEIQDIFPNEASAVAFVEEWRWKDGNPICPKCGCDKSYLRPKKNGHRCSTCLKDYSVRVGTIFENSRIPMGKWVTAICLMQQSRLGVSSRGLSLLLEVTQKASGYIMMRLCDVRYNKKSPIGGERGRESNRRSCAKQRSQRANDMLLEVGKFLTTVSDRKAEKITCPLNRPGASDAHRKWRLTNGLIEEVINQSN